MRTAVAMLKAQLSLCSQYGCHYAKRRQLSLHWKHSCPYVHNRDATMLTDSSCHCADCRAVAILWAEIFSPLKLQEFSQRWNLWRWFCHGVKSSHVKNKCMCHHGEGKNAVTLLRIRAAILCQVWLCWKHGQHHAAGRNCHFVSGTTMLKAWSASCLGKEGSHTRSKYTIPG